MRDRWALTSLALIIVAAMFLFQQEFSLLLLVVAAVIGLLGLIIAAGKLVTILLNYRMARQELRAATYRADKLRLESLFLSFPATHNLALMPDSPIRVLPGTAAVLQPPLLPQGGLELLPALDSVQRGLIVGASDAGKTTLLRHIIDRRSGRVVVIDPHAYPGKWASGEVFGTGRDYPAIGEALDGLIELMTRRYEEIGQGHIPEMGHERVTVIIDEWRVIVLNVKPAAGCIKTLLTESRKAAFSVFVASHSERVRALGIEGEGDLRDGFAVVRLSLVNGERKATLDLGDGERSAVLPGQFTRRIEDRRSPTLALPPPWPIR